MRELSFIGIDTGTGVRALAVDHRGRSIATASRALPALERPAPGWSAQDPTLWSQVMRELLRELIMRLGDLWLAEGASNSGGAVLARFFPTGRLAAMSERFDPEDESGLDCYPLLRPGERFPLKEPQPDDDVGFLFGRLEGHRPRRATRLSPAV